MRLSASGMDPRPRRSLFAAASALSLMLLGAAGAAAASAAANAVLIGVGVGLGATAILFALVLGAARLALALLVPTAAVAAGIAGAGTEQLLPALAPEMPETLFLPTLRWAAFLVVLGTLSVSAAVAVMTVYVADGPHVSQHNRRWLDWLFIAVVVALVLLVLLLLTRPAAQVLGAIPPMLGPS